MEPKPIEAFGASLQGYYNSKCLSDAVIRCDGQEFAVHILVLFCHSDYFKRQLTGPWKESEDKTIESKDFDINIVEAMLRFVYFFDYDVPLNTRPMIFHAKVYQISDKYGIKPLKKKAINKFERFVNEVEVAAGFASNLADTITIVYNTTSSGDRGLRDILVQSSCKHFETLISERSFKEGLKINGDFSADLLSSLNENWAKYFNNGSLSDATIKCGGQNFAIHSLILFCHSEYFRKQLDGPWKESSERVIEITDFDPAIVKAMTLFFYCFDYESPADSSAMTFHAKVYQIADKYDIEALKRLASTKYGTSIDAGREMDSFPDAIELAYTTTPPGDRRLRDIAVEVTIKRIGTLMSQDAFSEMLSANSDLAADIIRCMYRDSEKSQGESAKAQEKLEKTWNGYVPFHSHHVIPRQRRRD
ncbi:ARM REPEAT PROTEIN INTERACTING WITH ABF2 [Fusarium agapanthi]|uniref:ARM REPEAT PROTEIN INTERACTING WITH ABF2 n=1 Tax=Fusarium agapanthi TaxID=1803897 RepID=A0A9P5BEL6_9HYPO|nr:ARM REPEAT PROTEIN INTERACTING WITH ABF2 [Fusarium agapanthi]